MASGIGYAITSCPGGEVIDSNSHGLFGQYQGDAFWIAIALVSLFVIFWTLLGVRRDRRANIPVNVGAAVSKCIAFSGFVAIAIFEVWVHR
jgi:hypothetical protein